MFKGQSTYIQQSIVYPKICAYMTDVDVSALLSCLQSLITTLIREPDMDEHIQFNEIVFFTLFFSMIQVDEVPCH